MTDINNKPKIDTVVIAETCFIAVWSLIFSAIMQAVFLIAGKWDYTVLTGNILSYIAVVANFFLMALTVQNALGKDEKEAKQTMKMSQSLRMLMLFIVALIGILLPVFNSLATVIPFLFTRAAILIRPLFDKNKN